MNITACAACGSADLRPPSVAMEGKIPGYWAVAREMVCRTCGQTTHPFEFEDETAWRAFVQACRTGTGSTGRGPACREPEPTRR